MASERKPKLPEITSPKATFKWPKLTSPDYGNDKYPKPDGEYSVKLVMREDDPAAKAFLAKLTAIYDDAMASAKEDFKKLKVETRKKLKAVTENPLFTPLYDQETEEPTGEIEFKVSCQASGTTKAGREWKKIVPIFDAKGKRMVNPPDIWNGTKGKVAITPNPYFIPGTGAAGLRLKLEAAQVIELSSGGTKDAKGYGFGEEEEGYEYTEEDTKGFSDESGEEAGDAGPSDF